MLSFRPDMIIISSSQSTPSSTNTSTPSNGFLKWTSELKETIDAIETCGDFAIKRQYCQFANPGLQIGDTLITLPLDPAQVSLIRDASRQAPFGRGDATLVDTSVRNTWELDASKFRIANPAWSPFVSSVLQDVSQSLGMSGVRTELYKLLLYEKDSFFKRHKDSEKAPGMIATLSICLPSRYKGGEVHLSHAGKNHVFDTSQSIFDISALAWYADVTHEIKPVAEGHRLALIYNIIEAGGDGATSANSLTRQDQKLQSAIARLKLQAPVPKRVLYFLDHKYSQSSLRIDHLKGRDRAIGQTLQEACMSNGCYLFLCNVTKRISDSRSYYYDSHEGPELTIDTIATCSGQIFASEIDLDKKDILGPNPYTQRDADSESEGEDTGNEGVLMEYRYHDSAVAIVPKNQLDQFFDSDVEMKVLFDVIMDDVKAHPEDLALRNMSLVSLSKAVEIAPDLSPLVLPVAWRMKEDSLFRTAVRVAFTNGIPQNEVIRSLVMIVKSDTSSGPVDWHKSFDEFVSCHRSLTVLSKSLDFVKDLLGPGELQTSFQQWQSTMQLLSFEGKKSLGVDDHDSIIELAALRWENVNWIRNTFLPKIRDCSDKQLLSKIICFLLKKDREGMLDKARDIASILLESGIQKLHLARIEFNSRLRGHDDWSECNRFLELVDNCLLSGLTQPVNELLQLSCPSVKTARINGDSHAHNIHTSTLADEILRTMCKDFEKNKMPPSEPARDFVIAVLRKFVLRDLPKCPKRLEGHAHRPRGCNRCKHCEELNEFLTSSSEKEREFHKGPRISEHLQQQLPRDLFRCLKRDLPRPNIKNSKPECFLKVTKLNQEYRKVMDEYKKDLRKVIQKVQSLRTEYMKQLLGDGPYSELVMLEKLPHAAEVEPINNKSKVGSKRPAGEHGLPDAKRLAS
ncbi:hypothetical protein F5Y19DRAFT_474292 [Xylariaceae sp. FL1651]|nr:hypothetical protein F5Y19DRAFT_474292 [Xylariaceae sp. FL1651]